MRMAHLSHVIEPTIGELILHPANKDGDPSVINSHNAMLNGNDMPKYLHLYALECYGGYSVVYNSKELFDVLLEVGSGINPVKEGDDNLELGFLSTRINPELAINHAEPGSKPFDVWMAALKKVNSTFQLKSSNGMDLKQNRRVIFLNGPLVMSFMAGMLFQKNINFVAWTIYDRVANKNKIHAVNIALPPADDEAENPLAMTSLPLAVKVQEHAINCILVFLTLNPALKMEDAELAQVKTALANKGDTPVVINDVYRINPPANTFMTPENAPLLINGAFKHIQTAREAFKDIKKPDVDGEYRFVLSCTGPQPLMYAMGNLWNPAVEGEIWLVENDIWLLEKLAGSGYQAIKAPQ